MFSLNFFRSAFTARIAKRFGFDLDNSRHAFFIALFFFIAILFVLFVILAFFGFFSDFGFDFASFFHDDTVKETSALSGSWNHETCEWSPSDHWQRSNDVWTIRVPAVGGAVAHWTA